MPTAEEYRSLYEAHYFGAQNIGDLPAWMGEYAPQPYQITVAGTRLKADEHRLTRIATFHRNRGSLLDIGLATGEFSILAKAAGWKVTGLDLSEHACNSARQKGIDVLCGDFLEIDFGARNFDVIHLSHVFEHFIDPLKAIARLRAIMHARSTLVLEVPNQFDSWLRIIANTSRRFMGKHSMPRTIWSIHHPYFYNATNLERMFKGCGFEVLWIQSHFPERWTGGLRRRTMGVVDKIADRHCHCGDNIEIAVRIAEIT